MGWGASVLPWIAAPLVAAAFAASACAWGDVGSRRRAAAHTMTLLEVALSYGACYLLVFAVGALPAHVQPAL